MRSGELAALLLSFCVVQNSFKKVRFLGCVTDEWRYTLAMVSKNNSKETQMFVIIEQEWDGRWEILAAGSRRRLDGGFRTRQGAVDTCERKGWEIETDNPDDFLYMEDE